MCPRGYRSSPSGEYADMKDEAEGAVVKRLKEATSGAKLDGAFSESPEGVEPDGLEREAEMAKQEGMDLEGEAAKAVVDVPLEGPGRVAEKRTTKFWCGKMVCGWRPRTLEEAGEVEQVQVQENSKQWNTLPGG